MGSFTLDGITPVPKGTPQIVITYNVEAIEKTSGKSKKLTVDKSKDRIEQMIKESEKYKK